MNLTINQIQDLSLLENTIKELEAQKITLQDQLKLSGQNNQIKLQSIYSTAFNNSLTLRSQTATSQSITELRDWENSNISELYSIIKRTYVEFLTSSNLDTLISSFVTHYNLQDESITILVSQDLGAKLQMRDLSRLNPKIDSKLNDISLILDFGDLLRLDLSFDAIKDTLVPNLISNSISI